MENWKCNFCGSELPLKNQQSKSSHMKYCQEWKTFKRHRLTKEYLIEEYVIKEKSAIEIAKELGLISARVIIRLIEEFGIPQRDIKSSRQTTRNKEKQVVTNLQKYGVTNPMKTSTVKNRVVQTKKNKYGNGNYNNPDKYVETMLQRYGIKYGVVRAHEDFVSKPHKKVLDYIKELGLSYNISHEIGKFYVDIFVNGQVIEIYGDFWHANPLYYNAKDVVNYPNKPRIAENIWRIDEYRINYIKRKGFDVLILWETEINKHFDLVKEKINTFIQKIL